LSLREGDPSNGLKVLLDYAESLERSLYVMRRNRRGHCGVDLGASTPEIQKKMPSLPKIGETWTDTHSGVEGIVAWVDGTTVTFVSLTGVRAAIGFNRMTDDE
jgi:hypothetical protein